MTLHEGSLLIVDGPLMTEIAAQTVGETWLAENPDRALPLVVVYQDIEGRPRVASVGDLPFEGQPGGKPS